MKISFVATERHFADHLAPIWRAIPKERRFRFYMPRELDAHAHALDLVSDCRFFVNKNEAQAEIRSICEKTSEKMLIVVSASGNVQYGNRTGNPVVLCQHGAGQSYGSKMNSSYAGFPGHKGIALFLHPGPHPARRDRRAYPGTRVVEIGSPRLDDWHTGKNKLPQNEKPVVAISFHWPAKIGVPEAGSQFDYYEPALKNLADAEDFEVIGHSHPRLWKKARGVYERLGIEPVREFDQVLKRADVYAIDNSSTLFEFASTGRPVLVLNGPSYRKSVQYGLRFWECATVGINVETPRHLLEKVRLAIEDPAHVRDARIEALKKVYTFQDGTSATRAAEAILQVRQALINRSITTKQISEIMEKKNVYMIAKSTFYNDQHEGRVTRDRGFWTTESRAKVLEAARHNLAYRADPPEEEVKTTKKVDSGAEKRKKKISGPDTTKDEGNLVKPEEALESVENDLRASGEEEDEQDAESWEPSNDELEQAMKERLGFGDPAGGGWIQIFIDGNPVHKSQGQANAAKDGRDLMKTILIEEHN